MKKLSKFIYLFILIASFYSIQKVDAVYSDKEVGTYEAELAKFPTNYQTKIKELHSIYPNAIFVMQDKFLLWGVCPSSLKGDACTKWKEENRDNFYKEIPVSWDAMLEAEKLKNRSEIYYTAPNNYKTSTCGEWSGNTCTWYVASEEAIKYYMNPYNFLDETYIFMFESQYYKDYHIKEGVEKILENSFMSNKNCPGSDKTYSEVLLEAAVKYNVSPYMLAARLIQEQSRSGGSPLISGTYSGYEELYDYFNIKAGGTTNEEKIVNGLTKAKEEGWTTPYLSIIGGSKFIYKEYVGINDTYNVKGQMTNYLQKWDPYGPNLGGHQYMQNIQAPYSEALSTYKSYKTFANYKNFNYVFYIPIFEGAPGITSTNTTNSEIDKIVTNNGFTINNEYISGVNDGTNQTDIINKLKKSDSSINVTIEKNSNNSTNNIATGDKITITKNDKTTTYFAIIYGDVNGDGQIKATDYVKIKNHIMGTSTLNGISKEAADVNKDGKIKATDYVKIKNHIMGISKITQ